MRSRKLRLIIGLAILLISLGLLAWGLWPPETTVQSLPISPEKLQLPAIWIRAYVA